VAFRWQAFFLRAAMCARPSAGWPSRPARERDRWASANSSRSGGAVDTHDRGHSERGSAARADRPRAGWSRRARESRRLRHPAPTDAGVERVVPGPAWVDGRGAGCGAVRPLRDGGTVAPTDARPDGSRPTVGRWRTGIHPAECGAARPSAALPTQLRLVASTKDTPIWRYVNLFIQRSLEKGETRSYTSTGNERGKPTLRAHGNACAEEISSLLSIRGWQRDGLCRAALNRRMDQQGGDCRGAE
jgi:hypothetical protein